MTEPLRMGVIGCGAIAQIMRIPYIVDYEQFELVALSDVDRSVLDAVGDRYGVDRRYPDWRDLLADESLEAVAICHSGSHHESVLAALEMNKHVFVEKPLAWNLRQVEAIAARAGQSDRTVQLGYHKLYDPALPYARAQIEKMRDLGFVRISVLHPENWLGLSPHRLRRGGGVIHDGHLDAPSWEVAVRAQLEGVAGGDLTSLVDEALGARKDDARLRLGYGMLTISLIHQVYTLFYLLGEPTRVISTEIWRDGLSIHSLIEYPNDVRCSLDWHYLSHLKDYCEEYGFYGNHDRVIVQFPSPYFRNFPSPVIVQGGEGELSWEKKVIVSYDEAFRNEMLAFYENVQKQTTPISSVAAALQHARFVQQLIDAAH